MRSTKINRNVDKTKPPTLRVVCTYVKVRADHTLAVALGLAGLVVFFPPSMPGPADPENKKYNNH